MSTLHLLSLCVIKRQWSGINEKVLLVSPDLYMDIHLQAGESSAYHHVTVARLHDHGVEFIDCKKTIASFSHVHLRVLLPTCVPHTPQGASNVSFSEMSQNEVTLWHQLMSSRHQGDVPKAMFSPPSSDQQSPLWEGHSHRNPVVLFVVRHIVLQDCSGRSSSIQDIDNALN